MKTYSDSMKPCGHLPAPSPCLASRVSPKTRACMSAWGALTLSYGGCLSPLPLVQALHALCLTSELQNADAEDPYASPAPVASRAYGGNLVAAFTLGSHVHGVEGSLLS